MTTDHRQGAPSGPNLSTKSDALLGRISEALLSYSDKDWNYSRIALIPTALQSIDGPYVLVLEVLDLRTKTGRDDLKSLADEVKWGERHSSELGVLELVSLRINKALLELTSDASWDHKRPIIRLQKKELVASQSNVQPFWYKITEVAGDDFDNR